MASSAEPPISTSTSRDLKSMTSPSPARQRKAALSPTPTPGIRRAFTVDDRPRASSRLSNLNSPSPRRLSSSPVRRRSSTFSDLSLAEARRSFAASTDDILLPRGGRMGDGGVDGGGESSGWHSAPLVFALLPALGGMLFQRGGDIVTDVMLLGLAAVFLNWSVRVPWDWYHSARSIRLAQTSLNEQAIIDDSSDELEPDELSEEQTDHPLSSVPEDATTGEQEPTSTTPNLTAPESPPAISSATLTAAEAELHIHELLSLLSTLLSPLLASYLLHTLRSSLSRPSEGLVSNYNLTIFLLASELRPLSHIVKLIQARTLYLQRIVAAGANPHLTPTSNSSPNANASEREAEFTALVARITELEVAAQKSSVVSPIENVFSSPTTASSSALADFTTSVRSTLQPDIDALNRAVRRYEKRATIQTMQVEGRLRDLEARVGDAVVLAAAAERRGAQRSGGGVFGSLGKGVVGGIGSFVGEMVELPFRIVAWLLSLPWKIVSVSVEVGKKIAGFGGPANDGASARRGSRRDVNRDGSWVGEYSARGYGSGSGSGGGGRAGSGYRAGGSRVKLGGQGQGIAAGLGGKLGVAR